MTSRAGILMRGVVGLVGARTSTLLRAYARRAGGELERALLALWQSGVAVPEEAWRQALLTGRIAPLEPYLEEFAAAHKAITVRRLRQAFEKGGMLAASDLERALALSGMLSLPHEAAAAWALVHGGQLITGITGQQRRVFQELLAQAQMGRMTVDELARRTRDLWGFTPQQVAALEKVKARLQKRQDQGLLTAERASKAYDRAVLASRRYRAYVISRHQTVWSLNAGQEAMWKAAGGAGLFNVPSARRVWIITPDELLCDFCQKMAGQQVKLGQPFIHPLDGRAIMVPQESHPLCRCTEGLVLGEESGTGGVKPPKPKKPRGPALLPPTPKPKVPPPSPRPLTPEEQAVELEARLRAPSTWEHQRTIEDIRKEARKRWGISVYQNQDFKQADAVARLNAAMEEVERMARLCGKKPRIYNVELGGLSESHWGGSYQHLGGTVKIGRHLVMKKPKELIVASRRAHTFNVDLMAHHSVMRHEYGHAVHYALRDAPAGSAEALLSEEWTALHKSVPTGWWRQHVSGYATTNQLEAFAESWAAYTSESYTEGALPEQVVAFFRKLILLWGGA